MGLVSRKEEVVEEKGEGQHQGKWEPDDFERCLEFQLNGWYVYFSHFIN